MENKPAQPLVVERTLNAPAEKVWQAITDPDQMKQWYFDLPGFQPVVGYEFEFTGGPTPERQYRHVCKITEVVAGERLTYSWRYAGYPGESFVTFALETRGEQTLLRLTHRGLETFPADNPDFAAKNFAEGWSEIIGMSLPQFLEQGGGL